MKKFGVYLEDVLLAFIKLEGYLGLFIAGFYTGQMMTRVCYESWMPNITVLAVVGFILSRICVNSLERMRRGETHD